jgi:phospholipase C
MRRLPSLVAIAASLFACSSSNDDRPADTDTGTLVDTGLEDAPTTEPPEWNRAVTPPSDEEATKNRSTCVYKAGALPLETQGKSAPDGAKIPIDTIVIVMMENRSFDHYFQKLPEATGRTDVEVAPADYTNPDVDGTPVKPTRDTQLCFIDTNHEWKGSHESYDDGKMDGFLKANDKWGTAPHGTPEMSRGLRALKYYDPGDLPFMFWAADQFAIADHYHCSLLGPTWPNRMYLYGATSYGRTTNKLPEIKKGTMTIFDELEARRIPWKVYASSTVGSPGGAIIAGSFIKFIDEHVVAREQFPVDAAAGKLPNVVFLDPDIGAERYDRNDEHPPAMMQFGQAFLADATKTLMASPQWGRSAMFITYDEHGGLYDHVPPPPACLPDDVPPELAADDPVAKFDRLGVRVPLVVISPWAKKRYAGHHVYDHTSITRFVEARFVLPAMSARDANAEVPWDLFDFGAARSDKPAVPDVPIDAAKLAECKTIFTP